jgi:hypothetical protein
MMPAPTERINKYPQSDLQKTIVLLIHNLMDAPVCEAEVFSQGRCTAPSIKGPPYSGVPIFSTGQRQLQRLHCSCFFPRTPSDIPVVVLARSVRLGWKECSLKPMIPANGSAAGNADPLANLGKRQA